jgi:hypothetical protein
MPKLRSATVTLAAAAIAAALATPAMAQMSTTEGPATVAGQTVVIARMLPRNNPALGLIYGGLATEPTGACARAYRLVTTQGCTPGPEAPPAGFDVAVDRTALPERNPKLQCDGDGVAGKRVQVVYARASDVPDRYADFADSIRQWAGEVDRTVRNAAAATDGERHVRFVHDADCVLDVTNVTLGAGGDDTLDATIADLAAQRLRNPRRKYLVFVDANVYCGIAEIEDDDSDARLNRHNTTSHVARVDSGCWSGGVAAHQLLHTLGAVQLSAPHSTGDWNCAGACERTDYLDTDPPAGSYLDTHWNVARSDFLTRTPQDLWGYVAAQRSTTAAYTPYAPRQRNSTNASNRVERTGIGAYTVTFPNLGVTGGTVNVTALTSYARTCKVNDWGHLLADLQLRVRCYATDGTPADTEFSATFARPAGTAPGRRFAYVWADQASTALYTPDMRYQHNSEGWPNSVTRSGTGRYQVRMPRIAGPGGSANVTAWGPGAGTCKLVDWAPSGGDGLVDVACHNAAGARADSRFTLTFHAEDGIFGPTAGPDVPRAHVLATEPTNTASYTPSLAEQFNTAGQALTITHPWPGWYSVRVPGFESLGGNVQVTALSFTGDSVRCNLNNWSTSWSSTDQIHATNVSVRCFDVTGAAVDAAFAMTFTGQPSA